MKHSKNGKIEMTIRAVVVGIVLLMFIANVYVIFINIKYNLNNEEEVSIIDSDSNKKDNNINDVIKEVSNSVVGISKIKEIGASIFLENGVSKLGLGTGIIVSKNGYILTNAHVSGEKYSRCYITLSNGKNCNGDVVWADEEIDIAVIKINENSLETVKFGNSDKINVGENVYAIGNPIGYEFQRSVTSGIVSALNRVVKVDEQNEDTGETNSIYMSNLIQTDAIINQGNSGGALIDEAGNVIGITTLKITSAEGMGFAIPINLVKNIIKSFLQNGTFEEAKLGIFAYDKDVINYIDNSINIDKGVYVAEVLSGSTADKVGIKEKDIIYEIDGIILERMIDLRSYIYSKNVKDEVNLKLIRNGIEKEVKMVL